MQRTTCCLYVKTNGERAVKRVPFAPANGKPGDRLLAGRFMFLEKLFAKFVDFCRCFRKNGSESNGLFYMMNGEVTIAWTNIRPFSITSQKQWSS